MCLMRVMPKGEDCNFVKARMMKDNEKKEETKRGNTRMQWVSGIIANLIFFNFGMQMGWLSPMAKVLRSQSSPTGHPLSEMTISIIASSLPITALICSPICALLTDKCGRKITIMILTGPQLASWLLKLLPSTTSLVAARVFGGIAAGGANITVAMYNREISEVHNRGRIGTLVIVNYSMGIFVMYALGAFLNYYTVLYIVTPVPIIIFFLMIKCPESPGYLLTMNKPEEAAKSYATLKSLDVKDALIEKEMALMKNRLESLKLVPSLSTKAIFQDTAFRRAIVLSTILIGVLSNSGNFTLITYGATILAKSGSTMNAEMQTLCFPACMMAGSAMSMLVMEKVGRRVILLVTYLGTSTALAFLGLLIQVPQIAQTWMLQVSIATSMFLYSVGVQPVPFIVMSEVFNIQLRARLTGFVITEGWTLCFVQVAAFGPITKTLGMYANCYWFATVHLIGVAAVLVLMPETRGKRCQEIETELRNKHIC